MSDVNVSQCLQVNEVIPMSFFQNFGQITHLTRVLIVDLKQVNIHWVYSHFCLCVHISCQRQIHEPCHIKIEYFTIILNSFQLFAVVAKISILNVVGFLDSPLHCNKFATKAVSWFKPKKDIYVYLHTLGESI